MIVLLVNAAPTLYPGSPQSEFSSQLTAIKCTNDLFKIAHERKKFYDMAAAVAVAVLIGTQRIVQTRPDRPLEMTILSGIVQSSLLQPYSCPPLSPSVP